MCSSFDGLPWEVVDLIAKNLDFSDFLSFSKTCRRNWVGASSRLGRNELRKNGITRRLEWLIQIGASIQLNPNEANKLAEETFRGLGPGIMLDWLMQKGALLKDFPSGMDKLTLDTYRAHGIVSRDMSWLMLNGLSGTRLARLAATIRHAPSVRRKRRNKRHNVVHIEGEGRTGRYNIPGLFGRGRD